MSGTIKRMTAILLSVIMMTTIFTALSFTVNAAKSSEATGAKSGTTGSCTWRLDDEGVLTISGNGAMGSYVSSKAPWGTGIISVEIKDGVTNIGEYAFSGSNIVSISIPNSVNSIGNGAFSHCKSLKRVDIPNGVKKINAFTFDGCYSLESINLPVSVKSIGEFAFFNCLAFSDIYFAGNEDEFRLKIGEYNDSFYDAEVTYNSKPVDGGTTGSCAWALEENGTLIISGSGNMKNYFYNDDEDEYEYSPWGKQIKNVIIKDGVTSIGYRSFYECTELKSVTIPDSVDTIGAYAFNGCTGLKSVTIPDSVEWIGNYAFGYYGDDGIQKIEGFTICGKKDSVAEEYANENGFTFVDVDEIPEPTEPTTAEPTTVEPTTAEPTTAPAPAVKVGDVNGDSTVNGADAGVLSRYASGWTGYADKIKNWSAADINNDGNVNGADAGILSRHVSGWTQYAGYFVQ